MRSHNATPQPQRMVSKRQRAAKKANKKKRAPAAKKKALTKSLTLFEAAQHARYTCLVNSVNDGHLKGKAAQNANVSERTARRWRANGPPRKRGRSKKDVAEIEKMCVKLAKTTLKHAGRTIPAFPSAKRIATELRKKQNIAISASTVLRYLARRGYVSRVRPRHPALRNAANRKRFAGEWEGKPTSGLLFSDEHWISTNDFTMRMMFVKKGTMPIPRDVQRRQNIPNFQLWGAVGVNWRSKLVFFPKTDDASATRKGFRLKGDSYIARCLAPNLKHLAKKGNTFMHDGAKCHTANVVKAWMKANKVTVMAGFPSSSPDLNPIESLWGELNRRIAELMPHYDVSLMRAARRAWREIPQKVINAHVRSFQAKCAAVYRNNGI